MAITNANYWPLGSTIQKTITNLSSPTLYRNCGIISVNPTNGHTVIFYRRGGLFSGPGDYGKICIRHSSDGGANWGIETIIREQQGTDLRNLAGGYDSKGRLFVFYAQYNPDPPQSYLSMNYFYSDNDGSAWSIEMELSEMSNTFYSPHGHIVDVGKNILDNNNTLYQSWSGNNGTGTTYKLYLYKSIDSGAHFYEADIKTIYSGAEQLSQPSMVNLGGGCFLVLAKKNDVNAFRQFKNENNITESWNDYNGGITNFDDGLTSNPAPPWLSFINYQGVGIVACYYTKKNTTPHILKVIFGLAKDLLETNGHLNWNVNTKKAVYPDPPTGNNTLGYQSFFHPLNQFKGIGNTFEGVGNVYNPKIVFTPQSGMINLLTTLGL